MQDLARQAGVSRMTVSLALRNNPQVSESTRAKIVALAEKMGYRVDPLIQRLTSHLREIRRSSYSGTLALITGAHQPGEWRHVRAFTTALEAARKRAGDQGYRLEEFWLKEKGMTGMKLSRILEHRGIDGLIVAPIPAGGGHLRLDWSKFAIAAMGYSMIRPIVHRAVNYQLHSGREAIRQLHRLGYRRIGMCMSAVEDGRVDHNWKQAFLYYQTSVPAKDRIPPLMPAVLTPSMLIRWVKKEQPDSILVQGPWVHDNLVAAGYRIPDDIGLALLDWPDWSGNFAGIDQRHDEVGIACVDLVVAQLYRNERGLPDCPRTIMIEGRWKPGGSVRAVR